MIVSASRRTDIPACYGEWFLNRLREGYALARNPINRRVSLVSLRPGEADGIVFWSKNPAPMLPRLGEIGLPFYFQFTLTAYGEDVEPGLPDRGALLDTFRRLSDRVGPERVLWRYDPIFLSPRYPMEFHGERFAALAERLRGYTASCTISFIDEYRNTRRNARALALLPMTGERMRELAAALSPAAQRNGMALNTCCEEIDLADLGVGHGRCVDGRIFERLWGLRLDGKKDRNQRPGCGCARSVDVGEYNTCPHGCLYCYANYNPALVARNLRLHDPASPLLVGWPEGEAHS